MENALLVGLSRQMALSHELDVVANNIANINTTGFKADNAAFSEFLMSKASDNDFGGKDKRVSFVQDRHTWIDLSPGAIERTGNPLDVAIDGKGYLTVQTQRGPRYTRNGSLSINATGQLVTSEGDQVMGDGRADHVSAQRSKHQYQLHRHHHARATAPVGRSARPATARLFRPAATAAERRWLAVHRPPGVNAVPVSANTRVVQGGLEKSNVNAIAAMARMIEITRSYSDISAILQQESDQRRSALQQLSQPPSSS